MKALPECEKSAVLNIGEMLEYVPGAVAVKIVTEKITGNIHAYSLDAGEKLEEQVQPFDRFVQIIDGTAEIVMDTRSLVLETGQSVIIPAHTRTLIKANDRFKMISTVIKSGYEEVSL